MVIVQNEREPRRTRATFFAATVAGFLSLLIFISTLQVTINGSADPYTTDVGEIQNALARWGTIHFTGYPLYTALGSLLVSGMRLLAIPPAAGASLYSALWGALAIAFLTMLMMELGVKPPIAVVASLLFALSTSLWIDASLAELHTMTMALTFATLLFAIRFYRQGQRRDLYWLAFLVGQAIAHQRAFLFSLPALALLTLPHWRLLLRRWLPLLGLVLLGPLTYLYLPLVDWLGSSWTFSNPGTWDGFWALVLDTKTGRIIELPATLPELSARLQGVVGTLNADWPWPLWLGGLIALGLLSRHRSRLERLALALAWIPYFLLSLIIWVGFVGDALLAAKLPVIALAAVGLALAGQALVTWRRSAGRAFLVIGLVAAIFLYWDHRPAVVAITRDDSAAATIAQVARVPPPADENAATLMALWGNDYWQIAYAHTFEDRYPYLHIVDHNADLAAIAARGDDLYTLSRTFYERPLSWWEAHLGPVSLSSVAPGVVQIRPRPVATPPVGSPRYEFSNGITIQDASLKRQADGRLLLTLVWQAKTELDEDYSVAVHLVRSDPPSGPDDILAQADRANPVNGWYPTSRWLAHERVTSNFLLSIPPDTNPVAVRVGLYQVAENGRFLNAGWFSLPVPLS